MIWEATAIDDTELNSHVAETFERVNEHGGARSLRVWLSGDPNAKPMHASCVPANGESLHLFTRRGIIDAMSPNARQVDMPVIELRRADGSFTRLYAHPEHGLIFSTQDLNL